MDDDNKNNEVQEVDISETEKVGGLVELQNLIDIKTKQVLSSVNMLEKMEGFQKSKKLLHQAEMLNPVKTIIITIDTKGELYLLSTSHEPSEVLHMMESAKKRLV
jgi:hypothetical protein